MKITKEWLDKKNACSPSLKYVIANNYIGLDTKDFLKKLILGNRLPDASWLISRSMNKKQNVQHAIFAAEQVIDIFEKQYPKDKRPRRSIDAAKAYLKAPSKKTKAARCHHAGVKPRKISCVMLLVSQACIRLPLSHENKVCNNIICVGF